MTHVLVATDGSEQSLKAARYLRDLFGDATIQKVSVIAVVRPLAAVPFASDFGMNFPIALDRDSEVGDQYRILGLPTTYFIGRDGVIRSLYIGQFESEERGTNVQSAIEGSELEARIQEILGSGSTGAAQ